MSAREDERRARWRRRAFAQFEKDPSYAWLRRSSGRRRLVVAHASLWIVSATVFAVLIESRVTGWPIGVLGVIWLLLFVWSTGLLNGSVGGVTELPYDLLDEAQTTVRRRAESDAHRVVQGAMFVVAIWALANIGARYAQLTSPDAPADAAELVWLLPRIPPQHATWVLLGVAVVAFLLSILPTYLLAWRLPDDVAEPEQVAEAA